MLQDLYDWFINDPTTVSSLVIAGISTIVLILFYVFTRKSKKVTVVDSYEEFLAEEFKVTPKKEIEFLQLPPEPLVTDLYEELEELKAPAKKVAKRTGKKTTKKPVKKTVKKTAKKATKARVEKK